MHALGATICSELSAVTAPTTTQTRDGVIIPKAHVLKPFLVSRQQLRLGWMLQVLIQRHNNSYHTHKHNPDFPDEFRDLVNGIVAKFVISRDEQLVANLQFASLL